MKNTLDSQSNPEGENEAGGIRLPNFKNNYEMMIIRNFNFL